MAAVGSCQGAPVGGGRHDSPGDTSPGDTSPHGTVQHGISPRETAKRDLVLTMLQTARRRLDSDLCFLSRGRGIVQVLDVCDGDADFFGIGPGSLVSFTSRHTTATATRTGAPSRVHTGAVDLGVAVSMRGWPYLGVPIIRPDGELQGTLCWLSHGARPSLGEASEHFVALLADVLAQTIAEPAADGDGSDTHSGSSGGDAAGGDAAGGDAAGRSAVGGSAVGGSKAGDSDSVRQRFVRLIESGGPAMTYQPVFDLPSLDCVGAEALARFPPGYGGAQQCFVDAAAVGLGTELELAAIRSALRALPELPGEFGLGFNASPATILSGRLEQTIADVATDRLVLEVTEHDRIDDWASMRAVLDALRAEGVRIAVDDVGVGFAGLQQLVQLVPDFVKMDRCLTQGIDHDPARRALASALVHFAEDTAGLVLAEGVETAAELGVVVGAGVHQAQGRYLAPPGPLPLPPSANRLAPDR